MPISLLDFNRPPQDNGRGVHGFPAAAWKGGERGYEYWIGELQSLGVKWVKVIDDKADSLPFCERLVAAGIFPIVRVMRRDLPPNDAPQPNPGHLSAREEMTIKKLIDVGVLYFETNNEPDNPNEWKQHAIPVNAEEAAKLVALNWLFDARFILEAGGYPGLPAVMSGSQMDLIGALSSLGRQDILLDGCWIAIHNYGHNRPLNYPADRVCQNGASLTPEEYNLGPLTDWVWWDPALGRPNTLDEINTLRQQRKNAGQVIAHDHAAFREYEYFDALVKKYVGRSVPIISTEGGYQVGRRHDSRYPRITPALQADLTVAQFEFIQRDAPDYFFACLPWLLIPSAHTQSDAWYSDYWRRAFRTGNVTNPEFPPIAVPSLQLEDQLPVVNAVRAMTNNPRFAPRVAAPPPIPIVSAPSMPLSPAPPPPPPPSEESIYLVQHGDTLGSIAKKFGVTVPAMLEANGLAPTTRIFAGQRLVIPQPTEIQAPPMPAAPVSIAEPASEQASSPPMPDWYANAPIPARAAPPTAMPAPQPKPGPSRVVPQPKTSAPPPAPASITTPAPPPAPRPMPPRPPSAPSTSVLDPRLAALNVRVEWAKPQPGESYWKLVRAEYQDPQQAGGNHHIIYVLLDDKGKPVLVQRVFQGLGELKADSFTDPFGRAKIPMWETFNPDAGETGPYESWVGGLPSDKVVGLGMPHGLSVNFVLTWQKSTR